jgi:hypothetical protein
MRYPKPFRLLTVSRSYESGYRTYSTLTSALRVVVREYEDPHSSPFYVQIEEEVDGNWTRLATADEKGVRIYTKTPDFELLKLRIGADYATV